MLDTFVAGQEELENNCIAWTRSRTVWMIRGAKLEGHTCGAICEVVSAMVAAGARPGAHTSRGFSASPDDIGILAGLASLGFCVGPGLGGKWFLTNEGAKNVRSLNKVSDPIQVFKVRMNLALEDMTRYEVMKVLQADEWSWREWLAPSRITKKSGPMPLGYQEGDAKVWYSTPSGPPHAYLVALHRAEELFAAGLPMVPHNKDAAMYANILRGKFVFEVDPPLALDIDRIEDPEAIEDAHIEQEEPFDELDKELESELDKRLEELYLEECGVQDEAQSEQCDSDATPPVASSPPHPSDFVFEDDPEELSGVRDGDSEHEAESVEEEVPVDEEPQLIDDIDVALENSSWGCFRITVRPSETLGDVSFGGWQASCLFHKKNRTTGCKKWFGLVADDYQTNVDTMKCLQYWCLSHVDFKRQRDHMAFDPQPADCPPLHFLEACKIDDRPVHGSIKTDAELDVEDGIVGPRGRGRGRGRSMRGRGRAGRGAHDGEDPPHIDPMPLPSSSTSSSSSD